MFEKIYVLLILATYASCQNYCDSEALNCKKAVHVGCNHKGVFDPVACKKWPSVKLVDFGKTEIELMVDAHNKRRNEAAIGNAVPGVTGTRLCTLVNFKIYFKKLKNYLKYFNNFLALAS